GVIAVAKNGIDDFLRKAQLAQLFGAFQWVRVRKTFVVEVMEQAGGAPQLELRTGLAELVLAVPADRPLHRSAVLAQRVGLSPLAQQGPRFVAGGCCHYSVSV